MTQLPISGRLARGFCDQNKAAGILQREGLGLEVVESFEHEVAAGLFALGLFAVGEGERGAGVDAVPVVGGVVLDLAGPLGELDGMFELVGDGEVGRHGDQFGARRGGHGDAHEEGAGGGLVVAVDGLGGSGGVDAELVGPGAAHIGVEVDTQLDLGLGFIIVCFKWVFW